MRKLSYILLYICLGATAFSQTVIPTAQMRAEIVDFVNVSGNVYRVEMNVTDESGKKNGTFIEEDSTWVLWQNCSRSVITNIDCPDCFLFNANVEVEITVESGNPPPAFGFVNIVQETPQGLGGYTSGIQSGLQQCVSIYYQNQISDAIANSGDGNGIYSGSDNLLPGENYNIIGYNQDYGMVVFDTTGGLSTFGSSLLNDDGNITYQYFNDATNTQSTLELKDVGNNARTQLRAVNGGQNADITLSSSDQGVYISSNTGGPTSSVVVRQGDIIFQTDQDFITPGKGATYAADYSAYYTDRSLVDKAYVDNQVSGAGDGNGMYDGSDSLSQTVTHVKMDYPGLSNYGEQRLYIGSFFDAANYGPYGQNDVGFYIDKWNDGAVGMMNNDNGTTYTHMAAYGNGAFIQSKAKNANSLSRDVETRTDLVAKTNATSNHTSSYINFAGTESNDAEVGLFFHGKGHTEAAAGLAYQTNSGTFTPRLLAIIGTDSTRTSTSYTGSDVGTNKYELDETPSFRVQSIRGSASGTPEQLGFDWLKIVAPENDTTGNGIHFYDKYAFPNAAPAEDGDDYAISWNNGTPGFTNLSSLGDGSIYTSNGDISTARTVDVDLGSSLRFTYNNGGFQSLKIDNSIITLGGSNMQAKLAFGANTDAIYTSSMFDGKGLQYAADYSGGFVDRSLVDKAYVDNAVTIAGDGNGIYEGSGSVPNGTATSVGVGSTWTINSWGYPALKFDNNIVAIGPGGISNGQLRFGVNTDATYISSIVGIGITYAADYSGTFVDRSLVDKAYVDNAVAGAGGDNFFSTNFTNASSRAHTFADNNNLSLRTDGTGSITLGNTNDFTFFARDTNGYIGYNDGTGPLIEFSESLTRTTATANQLDLVGRSTNRTSLRFWDSDQSQFYAIQANNNVTSSYTEITPAAGPAGNGYMKTYDTDGTTRFVPKDSVVQVGGAPLTAGSWTPTITPNNPTTDTVVSVNNCQFWRIGDRVHFEIRFLVGFSSTAHSQIYTGWKLSLPSGYTPDFTDNDDDVMGMASHQWNASGATHATYGQILPAASLGDDLISIGGNLAPYDHTTGGAKAWPAWPNNRVYINAVGSFKAE